MKPNFPGERRHKKSHDAIIFSIDFFLQISSNSSTNFANEGFKHNEKEMSLLIPKNDFLPKNERYYTLS